MFKTDEIANLYSRKSLLFIKDSQWLIESKNLPRMTRFGLWSFL